MTCFWDSILSCVTVEDFRLLGVNRQLNRENFIQHLKNCNRKINVLWQNKQLREQEKREHFVAIRDYNISGIYNGHMTSTCDSFLLLICELLKVNIEHYYMNQLIKYTNHNGARKILRFKSNRGHFSSI